MKITFPNGTSFPRRKKYLKKFLDRLNKDLKKSDITKDMKFYIDDDGNLRLMYSDGPNKGQDVKADDIDRSLNNLRSLVNFVNRPDLDATITLVGSGFKEPRTGLSPAQPEGGKIYVNVDAISKYESLGSSAWAGLPGDPLNLAAALYHELYEANAFRYYKGLGREDERALRTAHSYAIGKEGEFSDELGFPRAAKTNPKTGKEVTAGLKDLPDGGWIIKVPYLGFDGSIFWQNVKHDPSGSVTDAWTSSEHTVDEPPRPATSEGLSPSDSCPGPHCYHPAGLKHIGPHLQD